MNNVGRALRSLADTFERLGLAYAVIGGIAIRTYGIPRPTYDVDFTLSVARERLPEVFAAAEREEFSVPEVYRSGWVDTVAHMPLVKLRFSLRDRGVDADIFLAETPFQQQVIQRRRLVETLDGTIWLASPEDVVLLKLLANRPRDVSDVLDVLFAQGQLDEEYLRHWAAELGILSLVERILTEAGG